MASPANVTAAKTTTKSQVCGSCDYDWTGNTLVIFVMTFYQIKALWNCPNCYGLSWKDAAEQFGLPYPVFQSIPAGKIPCKCNRCKHH